MMLLLYTQNMAYRYDLSYYCAQHKLTTFQLFIPTFSDFSSRKDDTRPHVTLDWRNSKRILGNINIDVTRCQILFAILKNTRGRCKSASFDSYISLHKQKEGK